MRPPSQHKENEVDISKMELLGKKTPSLSTNKGRRPSAGRVVEACAAGFAGAAGGFVLDLAVWDLEKVLPAL